MIDIAGSRETWLGQFLDAGGQLINPQHPYYGAKGDYDYTTGSGSDDTDALDGAMEDAASKGANTGKGAAIWLPPGAYRRSAPWKKLAGVTILGAGADASVIAPIGCDAIALDSTEDFASTHLADFGILGVNCLTNRGITSLGSPDSADWTSGVHMRRLRIGDMQTAVRSRNLHRSTVKDCWFQRVNIGVDHSGQNMVNWFKNNWMIFAGGCGAGTKTGFRINAASDYDPGGATTLRPESVHVVENFIYGFDTAIDVIFATLVNLLNNDLSAAVTGVQVATVDGVLNMLKNYVEVTGGGGLWGLHFVPLGTTIDSEYNVEKNAFIASSTPVNSQGIEIGTFGVGGNQSNINLIRNRLSGWGQYDISAYAAGDLDIIGNRCRSPIATSIIVRGTIPYGVITIEKNRCVGNISVPAANSPDAQIYIGENGGTFSTLIRGTISIPNGATTATLNFSAIGPHTKNFDTEANTGLKQRVFFGTPSTNVGHLWGSATNTSVTVNCSIASTGITVVPFEVRSYLSAL